MTTLQMAPCIMKGRFDRGAAPFVVVVLSLLAASNCFAATINAMHVRVKDLPEAHIRLIGPGNPDLDQFLNFALHGLENPSQPTLSPAQEMNVEPLKPVMVVLANNSDAAIVAYSLVFSGQDALGQPLRMPTWHIQPYALRHGDTLGYDRKQPGGVIPPKRRKIVTPFGAFDEQTGITIFSNAQDAADFLAQFQGGKVEIELDAVILDDGSVIGPDTSDLVDSFTAALSAKQDLLEHLVDRHNLDAEIASRFTTLMCRPLPREHLVSSAEYSSQYANYKELFVNEFRDVQRLSGDDKLRLLVTLEYSRYMGVPQVKRSTS
jgi:hypothetical protein